MTLVDYSRQLETILLGNRWFKEILETVRQCYLPQWAVGAGVIRNIVWSHLHEYSETVPVKDVDVVFYDPVNLSLDYEVEVEARLNELLPEVPWEVKNQAAVHLWFEKKFGYAVDALRSVEDAIATWPETHTCVGVRLSAKDGVQIIAPYGLDDLFQMICKRNPRRVSLEQYRLRVKEKRLQEIWPKVQVIDG